MQNHIRARVLAFSVAIVLSSAPALSQSIPIGGNLDGQPIIGSDGPYIATSGGVYGEDWTISFLVTSYPLIYKPPAGQQVVSVKIKKGTKFNSSTNILLVQLSDGTIVTVIVKVDREDNVGTTRSLYGSHRNTSPSDSATWKYLIGDAIYELGTPWSQFSPVVYVSRDSLETWQVDTSGLYGAQIQNIDIDSLQRVYAATNNGLFVQNPDSNVWHNVTSFTQATSLYSVFIDRANRILVSGNGGGLYLSTDNGSSWSSDTSGIGTEQVPLMTDDPFNNLYITTSASLFGFGSHVYKSPGGTSSWVEIDSSIIRIVGNAGSQTMQMSTLSGDSILIAGTSFGVFQSTDQGSTWTMNNAGIKAENIYGIAKTGAGGTVMSSALGIFSNTPPDTVWHKKYPQDSYESQLPLYTDGLGNIYTLDKDFAPLLQSGGVIAVIRSTDGGTTWSPDTAGLSRINGQLFYVDETGAQHYGGGSQFFATNPDLWSKPLGGSWAIDTTGFPTQNSNHVLSMMSDHNGYLYISGGLSGKKVMKRPIAGGTWIVDTTGIPANVANFAQMTPGINGDMYGVVGQIFTTQIYGTSVMRRSHGAWNNFTLPGSLSSPYLTGLSVDSSGAVFAAFADSNLVGMGVYFTTDNGLSWTYAGLDTDYVNSLVSLGDSTYALTSNDGVFYVGKTPAVVGVRRISSGPNTFALSQNYPNPFNPATTISYRLPAASHVTLKVYNILGQEVETLINETEVAGYKVARFDGNNVPSGVYFYRLQAGRFIDTKKMLLLK